MFDRLFGEAEFLRNFYGQLQKCKVYWSVQLFEFTQCCCRWILSYKIDKVRLISWLTQVVVDLEFRRLGVSANTKGMGWGWQAIILTIQSTKQFAWYWNKLDLRRARRPTNVNVNSVEIFVILFKVQRQFNFSFVLMFTQRWYPQLERVRHSDFFVV